MKRLLLTLTLALTPSFALAQPAPGSVTRIFGTTNQVIASAPTGPVTLSLPQSIGTTSAPTFGGLNLPATTTSSVGVINQGGSALIHTYFDATSANPNTNFFAGGGAGSFTLAKTLSGLQGDASLNVGVGYHALATTTSGSGNTAVGALAMANATATVDSAAFGYAALSTTNGNAADNTAIGFAAMKGDGAGVSNLGNACVGHTCMFSLTSGTLNSSLGKESLFSNTSGSNNFGGAFRALYGNTTGSRNVATGVQAIGVGVNTGNDNVASGYQALKSNTSGSNNVGLGSGALGANTTGSTNFAGGYGAGGGVTTGGTNLLIGFNAGSNITSGNSNLIIVANNGSAASATADGQMNIGGVFVGFTTDGATPGVRGTFLAGAAATPSVKVGDAGWYQSSAGKMDFASLNTRQASFEAGYFSILDNAANIRLGAGTDVYLHRVGGGGTGSLVLDADGAGAPLKVGIGTNAPAATLLSVGGAGSSSYTVDITGTAHVSTSLAFGTNPATVGAIRGAYGYQVYGRNSLNTLDRVLLDWGGTTSNELYIGDVNVPTRFQATAFSFLTGVVNATAYSVGTNPASTGSIRFPNAGGLYARNQANNADRFIIGNDTSNNVEIADSGATDIHPGTAGIAFGNATKYWGSITVGATAATSGEWRSSNNYTHQARNAANTANITMMTLDTSDTLRLGGAARSVANAGVIALSATAQLDAIVVIRDDGAKNAIFNIRGGIHATQIISDPTTGYSITAGTANRVNVYWSAVNSRYELENLSGGTLVFSVFAFGQ